MPRGLNSTYIAKIIRALEDGPRSYTELEEVTGMHQRTLSRYLNQIEAWGVIGKTPEGLWRLNIYKKAYEGHGQYRFLISHSERLLEGRNRIIEDLDGWSQERIERFIKYATKVRKKKGTEKDFLARMFSEHLRTGYRETFDKLNTWGKDLKETQGLTHNIIVTMEKLLPDSEEYYHMKINRLTRVNFTTGSEDSYGNRVLVVSAIIDELINLLRHDPSLTKIPYKKSVLGLQIGFAEFDMRPSLVQEVIEVLPQFGVVFDDIKRLNEYEISAEKLRGEIINALTSIAASVRSGKSLNGVCSGCKNIIIKGEEF